MPEPTYLTAEGAARLQAELDRLKGSGREELARRLRSAIQMGDLSENADYHKAKEDQAFMEGRILELEHALRNAIIVEAGGQRERVSVGARVTVQEDELDSEVYSIVGAKEADSRSRKISNESPIGRALMDKRVGETVVVETPAGKLKLKILKIE